MSAVKRHFAVPYQNLDELRAGLKEDEAEYTDAEIEEIIAAIGEKLASDTKGEAPKSGEGQDTKPLPEGMTAEEVAEFKAWKAGQKAGDGLSKQVAAAIPAPKKTSMQDFDVFFGEIKKERQENPFNPGQPHVLIKAIILGKMARDMPTRIEKHLAHQFNEYAIGQDVGMNHGDTPTARFYFPAGKYRNGDRIEYSDFAAFQSEDKDFKANYNPKTNISLLYEAMQMGALTR